MPATHLLLLLLGLVGGDLVVRAATIWTPLLDPLLRIGHHLTRRSSSAGRPAHAKLRMEPCGRSRDPLAVRQLEVDPNPIAVPGSVRIGLTLDVREGAGNVTAPLPVNLVMMKKIPLLFGYSTWLTVPCLPHNIGSCDYGDFCDSPLFKTCPDSCGCPFSEGSHKIPPAEFAIPDPPDDLPSYLMEGEFYIKAVISRGRAEVACYAANVDLRM